MTSVNAVIGSTDVSADILELDVWGDDLKVGRWEVLLKNIDNKYGDELHSNDPIQIHINSVSMMKGYLDDSFPHLGERGVYTNQVTAKGRDYGRDLARLMYSGTFTGVKGDDLIDAILAAKSSEITFTSPGLGGYITMERNRTYLIDWAQDVAARTNMNYSAYVAQNKGLHLFPVGDDAEVSGVDLKLVIDAVDNNILHLLKGEEIGFSIFNSIELSAGSLNDHWTDGNHADFSVGTGVYPPESCSTAGYYLDGTSSIKFGCLTDNDFMIIYLDFLSILYNYNHFDLSRPEECYFLIKPVCHKSGSIWVHARPWLEDNAGCRIEFRAASGIPFVSAKGKTESLSEGTGDENWQKVGFTVGDTNIKPNSGSQNNKWGKIAGSLPFDWTNVVKIGINIICPGSWGAIDLYLDSLTIPSIEVISQASDATSVAAYGTSEWFDQRFDIKSQIELDAARDKELEKRKDPLKNIQIIAKGQTGILYAGQSVTVVAPGHGIASATKYRIVSYHHQVRKNSIKHGFNFVTTLDLVSDELSPTTQVIDPRRYMLHKDPVGAALEILALASRRQKTSSLTQRKGFGDTLPVDKVFYSGSGVAFPAEPDDGFTFRLTVDIPSTHLAGYYQYDEGAVAWIRQPAIFRRSVNPTYGQVTGDINENTSDNADYRWTGSAWLRIDHGGLDGLDDDDHTQYYNEGRHSAVEHLSSMMAIELRPWTSNFNVSWDGTDYDKLYCGKGGTEEYNDADIKFDDGITDLINQKTEDGVPDGFWYLYWDENFKTGDNYDVKRTDDILVAIGVGKGLLATVIVDEAGGMQPAVQPWGGYTPTVSAGMMAVKFIDAGMLISDFVIGEVEIKTGAGVQWDVGGDPGVIITALGLRGKGAAGAIMAEVLASTGKITAAGGDVVLDDYGITIAGERIRFKDTNYYGYIFANHANTRLTMQGAHDLLITFPNSGKFIKLHGDVQMFGEYDWVPQSDGLGYIGRSSKRFREVNAIDIFGKTRQIRTVTEDPPSPEDGEVWLYVGED